MRAYSILSRRLNKTSNLNKILISFDDMLSEQMKDLTCALEHETFKKVSENIGHCLVLNGFVEEKKCGVRSMLIGRDGDSCQLSLENNSIEVEDESGNEF